MKHIFLTLPLVMVLSAPAIAGQTLKGSPQVVDGTTMIVAGKTVQLFGVTGPKTGTPCTWKSKRTLDCGMLATAGLKDITVASSVICTQQADKAYVCKADGFDLAYGLIHAGWALPTANAPKSYRAKRDNARANKRGLWHAIDAKGTTIASKFK